MGDHPGGSGSDPAQRRSYSLQYNTQHVMQRLQLALITRLFCADWKGQPGPAPRGRVLTSIPDAGGQGSGSGGGSQPRLPFRQPLTNLLTLREDVGHKDFHSVFSLLFSAKPRHS